MLPLRLELRNFLPYRAPAPLELDGLRLACLSGVNGAGKSALLDAITWALWGRARARRDDDLIHHGAKEMYVQLDFEQDGARFRALRRRQRGARSRGSLRLYELAEGEYRDISAATMSATDERLRQLLRLDYDTFTHSAFLLQGRADAFTIRSPRERQQLLATILQLGRWETAAERARERETRAAAACAQLAQQQEEIAAELARAAELTATLQSAESAHQAAGAMLQSAETAYAALQAAPAALRHWQGESAAARARLAESERNHAAAESEARRWGERRQSLLATLADHEEIQHGYAALTEARAADRALGEQLSALRQLDAEIARLESQLTADRHALEAERARLDAHLAELERTLDNDDTTDSADLAAQIVALERRAGENAALRAEHEQWQNERRQREAANRSLRAEMEQLRAQIETLAAADGQGACPLCGQTLSAAHREQAQTTLRDRGREKGNAFRENQSWLRANAAVASQSALRENDRALLALPELKARARESARRRNQQRDARQRQAALLAERDNVEAQLAADEFSAETRQQLARSHSEREHLTNDPAAHSAARLSSRELAALEARHSELTAASAALPQVEEALAAANARLNELSAARAEATTALANLEAAETQLREDQTLAHEAERALQLARVAERQAYQLLLSARQEEAALARQRKRGQQLAAERQAAEAQRELYSELRRAFGPNGIPALLIETAIPDLQADANALLEQLSDAPLRLELRLARRGRTESLEILVRDEYGARGYELFSGGEAFRIHFALRVALARALARRAGTRLRALFVDEGFGTQDAQGRERLVRALAAIQHEFSLILVITHLEELRAAFPRQILVLPTAEGSQLQLH